MKVNGLLVNSNISISSNVDLQCALGTCVPVLHWIYILPLVGRSSWLHSIWTWFIQSPSKSIDTCRHYSIISL